MRKTETPLNEEESKEDSKLKGLVLDSSICYICQNFIRNPLMCPTCQKLTCKNCIKKWLITRNYCPYCRNPLTMKTIKTSELADKIMEYVNRKMEIPENKEKNMCTLHNQEFEYYCKTCKESLCKECAFLSGDVHQNHDKIEINRVYKEKYKELIELKNKKEDDLEEKSTYIEQLLVKLYQAKMAKLKEIDDIANKMKAKLEQQIKNIQKVILSIKENIEKKQDNFANEVNEIGEILKKYPKSDLIENYDEYFNKIKKFDISIKQNCFFKNLQYFFSENLTNIYEPPYQSWIISGHCGGDENFSRGSVASKNNSKDNQKEYALTENEESDNKNKLYRNRNFTYTPSFNLYGLNWYLLIEKNEKEYGNFSVFLHLDEEIQKPLMVGLKLEVINKIDEKKNITIEMEEIYRRKNQGWGSQNFFKKKFILDGGFVDKDNKFDIRVSIKPRSFAELYWVLEELKNHPKKKYINRTFSHGPIDTKKRNFSNIPIPNNKGNILKNKSLNKYDFVNKINNFNLNNNVDKNNNSNDKNNTDKNNNKNNNLKKSSSDNKSNNVNMKTNDNQRNNDNIKINNINMKAINNQIKNGENMKNIIKNDDVNVRINKDNKNNNTNLRNNNANKKYDNINMRNNSKNNNVNVRNNNKNNNANVKNPNNRNDCDKKNFTNYNEKNN